MGDVGCGLLSGLALPPVFALPSFSELRDGRARNEKRMKGSAKYITYKRIKIRQRLGSKHVPDAQILDSTKGQTIEYGSHNEEASIGVENKVCLVNEAYR